MWFTTYLSFISNCVDHSWASENVPGMYRKFCSKKQNKWLELIWEWLPSVPLLPGGWEFKSSQMFPHNSCTCFGWIDWLTLSILPHQAPTRFFHFTQSPRCQPGSTEASHVFSHIKLPHPGSRLWPPKNQHQAPSCFHNSTHSRKPGKLLQLVPMWLCSRQNVRISFIFLHFLLPAQFSPTPRYSGVHHTVHLFFNILRHFNNSGWLVGPCHFFLWSSILELNHHHRHQNHASGFSVPPVPGRSWERKARQWSCKKFRTSVSCREIYLRRIAHHHYWHIGFCENYLPNIIISLHNMNCSFLIVVWSGGFTKIISHFWTLNESWNLLQFFDFLIVNIITRHCEHFLLMVIIAATSAHIRQKSMTLTPRAVVIVGTSSLSRSFLSFNDLGKLEMNGAHITVITSITFTHVAIIKITLAIIHCHHHLLLEL